MKPELVVLVLSVTVFFCGCSLPDYRHHECIRACRKDTPPKVCRYRWVIENYLTLSRACYSCPDNQTDCLRPQCVSGDGVSRSIRTVNRMVPGPGVQVCEGDTIEVEVINQMTLSEGVTIHWHGLHQPNSPHMDGVAMVTQCPIPSFSSFFYRFQAEAVAGTHWWHSHSGLYRGDGLFGPLVIRQPKSRDPHADLYDLDLADHVMVVNDWPHKPVVDMFTAFYLSDGSESPESILINGRGMYQPRHDSPVMPLAEFDVRPDTRYRFRVINAGSFRCPIQLSIEDHDLLLIASDARPFEPFRVPSFIMFSGERYDFVLQTKTETDIKDGGQYLIRAVGLGDCKLTEAKQMAVLKYEGHVDNMAELSVDFLNFTEQFSDDNENLKAFNRWLVDSEYDDEKAQIASMTSVEPDDDSLTRDPDQQLFIEFAFRHRNNEHFYDPDLYPAVMGKGYNLVSSAMINNISNALPPSPMLTQLKDLDPSIFCNSSTDNTRCTHEFCECTHRLVATQGQVLELVVYNANAVSGFTHPLHLHGHSFRVVSLDRFDVTMTRDLFLDLDRQGRIERRLHRAPYKDTLPIPDGGYVVLRVKADNPGAWFMHCHVAFHAEIGMALTLQVTSPEGHLPAAPPDFPRCGQWPPTVDATKAKCDDAVKTLNQNQDDDATFSATPLVVVVTSLVGVVAVAMVLILFVLHLQRKRPQPVMYASEAADTSCSSENVRNASYVFEHVEPAQKPLLSSER